MRHFEDYVVGESRFVGTHTLAREEIMDFARTWDPQPFHVDEQAAKASMFGGLTASGAHRVALTIRMITASDSSAHVLAALGWDEVRFPAPAYAGDELSLTVKCTWARTSRSRPDRGIIKNRFTLVNAQDDTVLQYTDTIFVERRSPGAPAEQADRA